MDERKNYPKPERKGVTADERPFGALWGATRDCSLKEDEERLCVLNSMFQVPFLTQISAQSEEEKSIWEARPLPPAPQRQLASPPHLSRAGCLLAGPVGPWHCRASTPAPRDGEQAPPEKGNTSPASGQRIHTLEKSESAGTLLR